MRIEKEVAEAYKSTALKIVSPVDIDARIKQTYEKKIQKEREKRMIKPRKRVFQVVFIAIFVLLITGFTAQYFIKLGDDRLSMELSITNDRPYDEATASVVRGQIQQVRDQLKVGEKALVYSPEIETIKPPVKDLFYAEYVSNPYVFRDYGAWQAKLSKQVPGYKLPAQGASGLTFVGGEEEFPFGGAVFESEVVGELHSEVDDQGKELAWKKIHRSNEKFPAFTSIYKDDHQVEIKVSMQIVNQKTRYVGQGPSVAEKVTLNGKEALYTFNDKFLYSDTNQYQSLDWVETQQDFSIVYSIGSSAESMTKEKLISIGENLVAE